MKLKFLSIIAILSLLIPSLYALPVQRISDTVYVIGTNNPPIGNNIDLNPLIGYETSFAQNSPQEISKLVNSQSQKGFELVSIVPTTFSFPTKISTTLPQRSGMITSAILVFKPIHKE